MKKNRYIKNIISVFLGIVLSLVGIVPVFAAEDGMYKYEVTDDGNAVIIEYLGAGTATVTLPASLGGYPVVGVGECAFGKVTNDVRPHAEVQRVVIPSGVTQIGDRAFAGTSWFHNAASADSDGFLIVNGLLLNYLGSQAIVSVPSNVQRINVGAFEKNGTINEVVLPDAVTVIDDYAFYKCTELERIIITGKLEAIGKSAFYGCKKLNTIEAESVSVFPDSLKTIGEKAFYECEMLSGTIDLSKGAESIGNYAFANCPKLNGIKVPDTVAEVGAYALGFSIVAKEGSYYPEQNSEFTIYVSHETDPENEDEILKSYSKTATAIYRYATNPDGNKYFSSFRLVWDRLQYPFMTGDVNNDGKMNSNDARLLLRHAAKIELISHEDDLLAADVNKDGKINSVDARKVLRAASKIEPLEA